MKKSILLILFIVTLSVLQVDVAFAVVDRGILVSGGGSICQEGETHFLLPDSCFTPSYGYLIIDSYVDPSYLNQYVEVEGELYYGVLCIMIDVETITLLGDPNQDTDEDGLSDVCDNCPSTPNGPDGGTCIYGNIGAFCMSWSECGAGLLFSACSKEQEDNYPPQGNGIGDACDCESDFNCDGNVDALDVDSFLFDFGRNEFNDPCTIGSPCNGDSNCDSNVDATDVTKFLEDFGRNQFNNQCPECVVGDWCTYIRFTDNGDGTVTDNYRGLVWLKEAHCSELNPFGVYYTWGEAMEAATSLSNGDCGLTDGSSAGDWRLPTLTEWDAFACKQYLNPAICDTSGLAQWTQGNPFTCCDGSSLDFQDLQLWTSTLVDVWLSYVGMVDDGSTYYGGHFSSYLHVWPIRDP